MIKLNLYPGKKPTNLTKIAGFDLLKINKLGVVIAFLFWILPGSFIQDYFKEEKSVIEKKNAGISAETREKKKQIRELNEYKDRALQLDNESQQLTNRLNIIKKIFENRVNPFGLLVYLANNIPSGLWITELKMTQSQLILTGGSYAFKDIGKFIDNLENSIYVQGKVRYSQENEAFEVVRDSSQKIEGFKITANIKLSAR